jgi:hypothetical protein
MAFALAAVRFVLRRPGGGGRGTLARPSSREGRTLGVARATRGEDHEDSRDARKEMDEMRHEDSVRPKDVL